MPKLTKLINLGLSLALLLNLCLLSSCQKTEGEPAKPKAQHEVYKLEFLDLFDTFIQVLGSDMKKAEFEKIGAEIYQDLQQMHKLFDIFHEYPALTNLYTINKNAGKGPIQVDPLLFELLEFSKKMHDVTKGRTNIAMGAVLNLWHEARILSNKEPEKAYIPQMNELKQAAAHINIEEIKLNKENLTVEISDPQLRIDTGAIAKGFAAEKTAQKLEKKGISHLLLNFGGNVRSIGTKNKDGQHWKVAIQNPDLQASNPYLYMLNIQSKSTVTSGVYERFFTFEGKKYHHIIDGETLFPGTRYAGVSIITKDSGIADALSTAIFLLSEEEGEKLAQSIGDTEVLWVYPDGTQKYTAGFLNDQAAK